MRLRGCWIGVGAAVLAACGGAQADADRALQRMYDQPKAQLYESSSALGNGAVLRPPPAGTIAREDVLIVGAAMMERVDGTRKNIRRDGAV